VTVCKCADLLQPFGSDAFSAFAIWKPTMGSDQLDPCADVEGNVSCNLLAVGCTSSLF